MQPYSAIAAQDTECYNPLDNRWPCSWTKSCMFNVWNDASTLGRTYYQWFVEMIGLMFCSLNHYWNLSHHKKCSSSSPSSDQLWQQKMRRKMTHQQWLWVLLLLLDQWWWALESGWKYMVTCVPSLLTTLGLRGMGFLSCYKVPSGFWEYFPRDLIRQWLFMMINAVLFLTCGNSTHKRYHESLN